MRWGDLLHNPEQRLGTALYLLIVTRLHPNFSFGQISAQIFPIKQSLHFIPMTIVEAPEASSTKKVICQILILVCWYICLQHVHKSRQAHFTHLCFPDNYLNSFFVLFFICLQELKKEPKALLHDCQVDAKLQQKCSS